MQKSYNGLDDMLSCIKRHNFHKDNYQIGSGKSVPVDFQPKRTAVIVGYTDDGLIQKFVDSEQFKWVYVVHDFTREQLDFLKIQFGEYEDLVRPILHEDVIKIFRMAWECIDFVFINSPSEEQYKTFQRYYTYAKHISGGSNFDSEVHEPMLKHSYAPKTKFKDGFWMFQHEMWPWYYEKDIRRPIQNPYDWSKPRSKWLTGTGTLQVGKRYRWYEQDLMIHTNWDAKNPFVEYYDGMKLYDRIPDFEQSVRILAMNQELSTPIELRQGDMEHIDYKKHYLELVNEGILTNLV